MWNQGENRSTFWIFFGVVIIGSTPPITFHNKAAFNRSIIFFLSYSVGRCRLKKIKQIRFSPMTSRPRSAPPTPTGSTVPSPSTPPIQTERRWNFGNYFDYLTHSNKIAFLISLSRWCGIDIETPTVQCFPLNMILICRYLFSIVSIGSYCPANRRPFKVRPKSRNTTTSYLARKSPLAIRSALEWRYLIWKSTTFYLDLTIWMACKKLVIVTKESLRKSKLFFIFSEEAIDDLTVEKTGLRKKGLT